LEVRSSLPWFVEAFLYPASREGLIQIGLIVGMSLLIDLFGGIYFRLRLPIMSILRFLLFNLVLFYFAYCVYDSSMGGRRAPAIDLDYLDEIHHFFSRIFLLLGCFAVCYWPASVYYCFRQTDRNFWLLIAGGSVFLPISLLAGVLSNTIGALNPISMVTSISRCFFAYCVLFVMLGVLVMLGFGISKLFNFIGLPGFIFRVVELYLLFIAAYFLGRFYWYNKYKLKWDM